jgi:glyoxylase-like metal-dependent hydrolase (beta-lactamase superfamily II)
MPGPAGAVEEVAPGVHRVLAPNPGLMTGPGTNTYLIGERQVALIDPGPDDDSHLASLLDFVGNRLGWILVTHTHLDHSPLAARLREETGAAVLGWGGTPLGSQRRALDSFDTAFRADRQLSDGDRIETGEAALVARHTPGHASGHLCFSLEGAGLLFSGDHVMDGSTVVIAPPDGDMADYFHSLEEVRRLRPRRIAPGHGDLIEDPASVLDEYLRHRRAREVQVLDALRSIGTAGAGTAELVEMIYRDVPTELHPVARSSVWAHLRKLVGEGVAVCADPDDPDTPWYPAP